jgi:hypothetical protein
MSDPVQDILAGLEGVKQTGEHQWQARCPAHDDRRASLCVGRGNDGRALVYCQAGCSTFEIRRVLGLPWSAFFPPSASAEHAPSRIVATYDYRDAAGQLLFQVVRFEPKDFRQRRPDGNGGWLWELGDTPRVLYRLPELMNADPAAWIFVVEGEKDTDNLAAMGLPATCNPGGAGKWSKLSDDNALHGRRIAIIPDKDDPGHKHAQDVAARLKRKAAEARILNLPGPGKDVSDWIVAGGTAEKLLELIHTPCAQPESPTDDYYPTVLIDTDEHRVVSETVEALAADVELYHRGGILVRVLRDNQSRDGIVRPGGSPTIQAMPAANLRERMTRYANFVKPGRKDQQVPAHPPAWLVSAVEARGEWPQLRHISAVSDAPVMRADGSIWQTPGYDQRTGVLFETGTTFPSVHPEVGIDDAVAALDDLMEVVCDFTFEAQEHKSAWLAALLTPLARFAFDGPSPLFLIDANIRGAGKGLLAQTIGRIVLGREMPVSSYAHDSEEMRKRITAISIAGDRMILLDNLEGAFGNDALDRALTSTRWKDRLLGRSEEVDLPLLSCWYATGNNVSVAADTTRRLIHVRLDVLEERPEERTGFRHPDLLAWINQNRPRLLTAAMTILSAYCRSGRPNQGLLPFGSFEGWSGLVRQAVVWVGLPDPCLTRLKLSESSDTTADAIGQLLMAWKEYDPFGTGVVVSEMLNRLYPAQPQFAPRDETANAMRAALENMVGCPPGKTPTPRQVGNKLRHFRRRVWQGQYLDFNANEYSRGGSVWRLLSCERAESESQSDSLPGSDSQSRTESQPESQHQLPEP